MSNYNFDTLRKDCSNLESLTDDALFDIKNKLRAVINSEYITLYNKICDEIFHRGLA